MKTKQDFLLYLDNAKNIISTVNIENNETCELEQTIEQQELIIPVVGGFSAGKSSLINSFLGEELLPTALTPETALATELRYSQESYIEAYKTDTEFERFDVNQMHDIKKKARGYKFLRLYLNNDNLKFIQPFVLVDMPGFDSPIEGHSQAIINYLNKGVYFVFLTSIEDGTISRSMIKEIKNTCIYGKSYSFCISKTNLRADSDVQQIQTGISEQLFNSFEYEKDIVLIDNNGGKNLEKIISSIDKEQLFKDIFKEALQNNYFMLEDSINVAISAQKATIEENEEAKRALEETIRKINRQKESSIADIKSRYSSNNVNKIISAVNNEIIMQKDYLVDLAISSQDSFTTELNSIVKNTLLSEIKSTMNEVSTSIINDFNAQTQVTLGSVSGFNFDDEFVGKISQGVETGLHMINKGLDTLSDKTKGSYKVLATIVGITTSIVSPVIELVIVFLPEILSLLFGGDKEKERRKQIENQLVSAIIPQIKSRIRSELPDKIQESIQIIIEQTSAEFEEKLSVYKLEIDKAIEKEKTETDSREAAIQALQNAKLDLQQLATPIIFS